MLNIRKHAIIHSFVHSHSSSQSVKIVFGRFESITKGTWKFTYLLIFFYHICISIIQLVFSVMLWFRPKRKGMEAKKVDSERCHSIYLDLISFLFGEKVFYFSMMKNQFANPLYPYLYRICVKFLSSLRSHYRHRHSRNRRYRCRNDFRRFRQWGIIYYLSLSISYTNSHTNSIHTHTHRHTVSSMCLLDIVDLVCMFRVKKIDAILWVSVYVWACVCVCMLIFILTNSLEWVNLHNYGCAKKSTIKLE